MEQTRIPGCEETREEIITRLKREISEKEKEAKSAKKEMDKLSMKTTEMLSDGHSLEDVSGLIRLFTVFYAQYRETKGIIGDLYRDLDDTYANKGVSND